MTDKKVDTKIPIIFQNIKEYENEDSRFLKVKIWLMHTLENFNGSSFSKEVVNKAIPSLSNTPLLAFIEKNSDGEQDFSDHRIVLHRSEDGELDLKYMGEYVGLIPETNNAQWEFRMTDTGEMKEYLTVEALMWTKKNDPVDIMKRKGFTSQSMELAEDYTGYYDEQGIFHFEDFKFFGACLLGNDVLPAMQNSTAEIQFTANTNMQKNIEKKLQEFYTLFSQEGGNKMPKENEAQETEITELDETTQAEESVETTQSESETTKVTHTVNPAILDNSTEDSPTDTDESFTDTSEQSTELDEEAKATEETEDESDGTSEAEVDYEAKFNELSNNFTSLASDYEAIKSQLESLQSYKRQREEDDLKAKFEGKLSDEEFTQVFSNMKDSDLAEVEDKLFALVGKKNFSIQSTTKEKVNKITITPHKEEENEPYGGLFKKYQK
jgi:hypothetical protein